MARNCFMFILSDNLTYNEVVDKHDVLIVGIQQRQFRMLQTNYVAYFASLFEIITFLIHDIAFCVTN